jgi:hypothetical protein
MADIAQRLIDENIIGRIAQDPERVERSGLRIDLRLIYQADVDGVQINQLGTVLWGHQIDVTPELLLDGFDYNVCLGYDDGTVKMHIERCPIIQPGFVVPLEQQGFLVKIASFDCDIDFIHDALLSLVQAGVAIKHDENENVFDGQNMVVFPEF